MFFQEVSASASKVSKKGDHQPPSTPSRKRLSQDITASPSLRRKSFGIKPKVMFTGVVDEQGERIIKDLGGSMAETIQECTHLITDKIRRTVKLLGGISLGIQIITRQWLDDSKQAGMFLDSSKYILCDKASEKQYKFSLRHSIEIATQSSMLEGYKIHVTKSVKPPPQTMAEILECSGAQVLKSLPKKKEDNMVIISCDEDKTLCQPAISNGIDIVSSEFILTGILRQQIDIQSYPLLYKLFISSFLLEFRLAFVKKFYFIYLL
ncbi:hypothetical protein LOTGIDRAFT_103252 [Lottia gigantea]|uniref:BRCT domain-containing protein n=1 Tax=Lottia gigantea TaxID=225164 RepID=V4ANE4_LOTGI|nr:hypothetical protein LOTGIDRAFT_103252 [Lottia gigantea]ESP05694.1 hypothetical protein LOTGIDRAFT_103252 [Lottia gigantea]